jgi:hypothetical protein
LKYEPPWKREPTQFQKVPPKVNYLQRDWYPVIGESVELHRHDQAVREGVIDAVTGDDAILWLAADGIHQCQLFTREDGYQVWIGSPVSTERGS